MASTTLVLGVLTFGLVEPASASGSPCGISAVAAGGEHSLAIAADGTVRAWGSNVAGEIGDGTNTDRHSPVEVLGLSGVTAVAAGINHSVAIGAGGTVYTWGSNVFGQLGDGTTVDRSTPVQVLGLSGVTAVAAGVFHTVAVGPGGTVYTWGYNPSGQLGDGTTIERHSPVQVPGLTGITAVAAVGYNTLARSGDGTVYAWGDNRYGQIGDGTTTNRHSPVQVPGATGVTAVAAGSFHSMAIGTGGTVRAWGYNGFGQIGDGTTTNRHSPVTVAGLSGITAIAAGDYLSLAIGAGGAVHTWGRNEFGQLGDGTTTERHSPVTVAGLSGATAIAAGREHSLAIGAGGTVFAWGRNQFGQVGDSTTTNRHSPVNVLCTRPSVASVSDAPDPVMATMPVTFSVSWNDPNPGDRVRAVICKTNAVSAGTCPGGAWAIGALSSSSPATASYTTTLGDSGSTHDYFAFACDDTLLCSASTSATFTVSPPACSDGADNDGDAKVDYPDDPGCGSATDLTEGPTCPPIAAGVIVCLAPGAPFAEFAIGDVTTPGSHRIAGYVDLYRFTVATVTTTVPCANVVIGTTPVNPCALAGGTYVSRVATLFELADPTEPENPLTTVRLCNAELTVTAMGAGIDSLGAFALC